MLRITAASNIIAELTNLYESCARTGDKLSADICQAAITEIERLTARIEQLEDSLSIHLAVAKDDPLITENPRAKAAVAHALYLEATDDGNEIERLRPDKERLDWLERFFSVEDVDYIQQSDLTVWAWVIRCEELEECLGGSTDIEYRKTPLRQAIDVAREAGE